MVATMNKASYDEGRDLLLDRPHASNLYVRQVYRLQQELQGLACNDQAADQRQRQQLQQVTDWLDQIEKPLTVAQVCRLQQRLQTLDFGQQSPNEKQHQLLQQISALLAKLDEPLTIAVVGAFNSGKSTLINAFFKQEWMPMHVNRTTATVNRMVAGEQALVRIVYRDSCQRAPVELPYQDAATVAHTIREAMATQSDTIAHIDLLRPQEKLLRHFTIIDTPGLNFSQADDATTLPYLYDADVLIWVFLPENVRTQDQELLTQYRARNPTGRVLAVVNGCDTIDASDRQQISDRVHGLLVQPGIAEQLFLISARDALMGQRHNDRLLLVNSGFVAVTDYLYQEIFPDYVRLQPQRIDRLSQAFMVQAAFSMAEIYHHGHGTAPNLTEAVKWYRVAAEQGHRDAQNHLGVLYRDGKVATPEENWMKSKIASISPAIPQQLRRHKLFGPLLEGVWSGQRQDYQEALKWLRLAAEQGHAQAQNSIGNLYRKGQGVEQDYQEALQWYRRAAEQGHANAQNNIGNMYRIGEGVAQDYQEALRWYRLAAGQGHAHAQKNIDLILST
ncbi:MAG: SEL1-like repeat protein [Magnetococcales bacterium]|nr:SEL1-like repeat protein [Magnetococcales bacterium]